MTSWTIISLVTLLISLVCCVGGIWALLHEKRTVDENGKIVTIEIDGIGKFKSNYPSLGAICIGALLACFVIAKSDVGFDNVNLQAQFELQDSEGMGDILVGVVPMQYFRSSAAANLANNPVNVDVDKRFGHFNVIAFTVSDMVDSVPKYSLVHGQAQPDPENGGFIYSTQISR